MRAIRYAVDEATASLWRGRQAGLLSTLTIALALFVLGAFLLVTSNVQRLGAGLSAAAELSVYLQDDISTADRAAVEGALQHSPLVTASEFVSKDEARLRFKRMFSDLSSTLDGAGENPLPASYEVRLQASARSDDRVDALAGGLRTLSGVADVRYDGQWLDRLLAGVALIRSAGFLLGGVLTVAAALTVSNVVRLALYNRRDELDIMELVGAPQAYIRGPFVVEGILQGGIGALLALAGLAAGFYGLRWRYLTAWAATVDLPSVRFLPIGVCLVLVTGGMLVGCVGGLVAARRGSREHPWRY
jgi:cell division transport system permease protein